MLLDSKIRIRKLFFCRVVIYVIEIYCIPSHKEIEINLIYLSLYYKQRPYQRLIDVTFKSELELPS